MTRLVLLLLALSYSGVVRAQTSAKLMRHADVSATQVAFVYGGDIWVVPKTGGTAIQAKGRRPTKIAR